MKILFCCETYYPNGGGVAEVMRQIAERLVCAGHEVIIATSYNSDRRFTEFNDVKIVQFNVVGNLVRGMTGEIERYRDFVVNLDCDAVLIKAAQQWTFDALWPILDKIPARKVFIPCGFSGFYDAAYAQYFSVLPEILRKFDHLIFYAERYRDIEFARAHGLTRFSIVPNGASEVEFEQKKDPNFRARMGIGACDFVFLSVGSPISMKGHREIAEAFALLDTKGEPATLILNGNWPKPPPFQWRKPFLLRWSRAPRFRGLSQILSYASISWRVLNEEGWRSFQSRAFRKMRVLAGRAKEKLSGLRKPLQGEKSTNATDSSVFFQPIEYWIAVARGQPNKKVICTNLARSELVQAYQAANLFVFASKVEYSPLVLFEAAASGVPFLSVPVGNAEEIAAWTGAGIICPAERDELGYTRANPKALAAEMQNCMERSEWIAGLGREGKRRWREKFTWRAIAPTYEAILSGKCSAENA